MTVVGAVNILVPLKWDMTVATADFLRVPFVKDERECREVSVIKYREKKTDEYSILHQQQHA